MNLLELLVLTSTICLTNCIITESTSTLGEQINHGGSLDKFLDWESGSERRKQRDAGTGPLNSAATNIIMGQTNQAVKTLNQLNSRVASANSRYVPMKLKSTYRGWIQIGLNRNKPKTVYDRVNINSQLALNLDSLHPMGLIESLFGGIPVSEIKKTRSKLSKNFNLLRTVKSLEEANKRVYYDWTQIEPNCVPQPRDQGLCGACYAIASMNLLEFIYCRETGKQVKFSPQYMISCGLETSKKFDFPVGGCDGGEFDAITIFIQHYGIELDENEPYLEEDGACPVKGDVPFAKTGKFRPKVENFQLIPFESVSKELKDGPMLAAINLPAKMAEYSGGFVNSSCIEKTDHLVVLLSEGITNGIEWFGFLNTWGAKFGVNGMIRIAKNQISCFDEFYKLQVKFNGL